MWTAPTSRWAPPTTTFYAGVAFPVLWTPLDKQGNSHSDECFELIERLKRRFPNAQIRCLTGDWVFVGLA